MLPQLRRRVRAICILLVAVSALPTGSAESAGFQGAFETTGTAELQGNVSVSGSMQGWMLASGSTVATARLATDGRQAHLVNLPVQDVVINAPRINQVSLHSESLPEETGQPFPFDGTLVLSFPADGGRSQARVLAADAPLQVAASSENGLRFHLPGELLPSNDSAFASVHQVAGRPTYPPSPYGLLTAGPVQLDSKGIVQILVAGPVVDVGGRTFATGRSLNESRSSFDPATGSGRYVYDNWMIVLEAGSVAAICEGCIATMAWTSATGTSAGSLWHGLHGTPTLEGNDLAEDPGTLHVVGTLAWTAQAHPDRTEWRVDGMAERVLLDATLVWASGAAVGAGLGLAALAVVLLVKGQAIVGLLARTGSRLVKVDILGRGQRQAILEAVHGLQPATLRQLQAHTGMSRGNLRYHLRALTAHEVLQSILPAGHARRNRVFMLNSGSLMQPTAGLADPVPHPLRTAMRPGVALASVNANRVRRAVFDHLLAVGPQTYSELRQHLVSAGIVRSWPASTASFHLGKLVASQAVTVRTQEGRKMYAANLDPGTARSEQYRAYLSSAGLLDVVRGAAGRSAMPESEFMDLVRAKGPGGSARAHLRTLLGLAVVRVEGNGLALQDDVRAYALAWGESA